MANFFNSSKFKNLNIYHVWLIYLFLYLNDVCLVFSLFACIVGRWVGVVVEYQIVYQFNDSHI